MMTPSSMQAREAIVRRADLTDLSRLARCDFSFEVAAELAEPFDGMRTAPVKPPYPKSYGFDKDELGKYLNRPDAGFFVAEVNSSPIGYVVVTRGRCSSSSGVARRMTDEAVEWARGASLASMRLETQSVNLAPYRFYERYRFLLGGHDRYLYRGLHPDSREVALFWYLPF